MATKQRDAKGGAYEKRGDYFARVTIAPQKRAAERLPWCADLAATAGRDAALAAARTRAEAIQAMINRLRAARSVEVDLAFRVNLVERAAAADDAMLAAIGRQVDALLVDENEVAPPALAARATDVVTFEEFAMRWVIGDLAEAYPDHVERKRSAKTDLFYLRRYVFPVVGPKRIADVTLEDYERVMREIPLRAVALRHQRENARARRPDEEKRARSGVEGKKLKPATRRHIAQCMRRVLQLAEYPAKLVARNPIPANALPKVRTTVALQFLYPDEDALLMKCRAVDLGHRLLYGFLARMGWRREEALGGKVERVDGEVDAGDEKLDDVPPLTWARLDLKRGVVFIDRDKTNDPRPMPLDPGTWRALSAWRERHRDAKPSEPVFVDEAGAAIDPEGIASRFREVHLRAAGVDRAELFEQTSARYPIRLHDLRASFVTVAFANGRDERWVRDRTGHRSSALERYRRVARTIAELDLGDWEPLDEAIPELGGDDPKNERRLSFSASAAAFAAARRGGKSRGAGTALATIPNDSIGVTDGVRTRDTWSHKRPSPPINEARPSQIVDDPAGSPTTLTNEGDPSEPLPPRPAAASDEPSDEQIESAIVRAMLEGRGEVAELLARKLKARREERAGVASLDAHRRSRG